MIRSNLYGWVIVALCFAGLSVAMSARASLGLTMPVLEGDLGWTRSFVSTAGALTLIVMAVVAPLAGNALDRLGPRVLLTSGLIASAIGLSLVSTMEERWQFLLYFGVLSAIGFGVVANHVVSTTIAWHFEANRGLATGIATAGSTAGQLLLVPVLAAVLSTVGWRSSYLALGIAALVLAPIFWFAIRPGMPVPHRARHEAAASLAERLLLLARSPVFHALFWSFTICGFTTSGVIETHLIPYAVACGFPPLDGATAYGVLSGFNMLGMMAAGYLADRVHRPTLLGSIYIFRALTFLLLMQIVGDYQLLLMFAVAFGVFDYSTVPVTASLVASHLGLRIMGLTMGLLSAGHALGAAVGAFLGGYLFDLFARYDWLWIASVGLALAAGLMCFTIRETRAPPTPVAQPA